jgi:hypothetical protein
MSLRRRSVLLRVALLVLENMRRFAALPWGTKLGPAGPLAGGFRGRFGRLLGGLADTRCAGGQA